MTSAMTPFGMGGPFGMADRLLHELEDEMREMVGAAEGEGEGGEFAAMMPGRLWAAVDVKETPNQFELSTDVPGLSKSDIKVMLEDNM